MTVHCYSYFYYYYGSFVGSLVVHYPPPMDGCSEIPNVCFLY